LYIFNPNGFVLICKLLFDNTQLGGWHRKKSTSEGSSTRGPRL